MKTTIAEKAAKKTDHPIAAYLTETGKIMAAVRAGKPVSSIISKKRIKGLD